MLLPGFLACWQSILVSARYQREHGGLRADQVNCVLRVTLFRAALNHQQPASLTFHYFVGPITVCIACIAGAARQSDDPIAGRKD